ncbi:MAG: hypothetical protein ABL962_02650 [Fimbriimonadaceae bacterium]
MTATVTLKLEDLGFPGEARVVLEAYQRSSGMRFECGTIANVNVPKVLYLNEIDKDGSVLFRLKVIEGAGPNGKILGAADRIRPVGNDDAEGRRSIFPINECELGPEVWRVDVDDAGPVLKLNYRIVGFKNRILEGPLLCGMILPAAFRIVLQALADGAAPDDDDDDWRNDWLTYLSEKFGIDDDLSIMSEDDRIAWVGQTVRTFCEAHGFVDSIRHMNEGSQ